MIRRRKGRPPASHQGTHREDTRVQWNMKNFQCITTSHDYPRRQDHYYPSQVASRTPVCPPWKCRPERLMLQAVPADLVLGKDCSCTPSESRSSRPHKRVCNTPLISILPPSTQWFLFRNTLPVAVEAGVAFAAAVFFVVPPVTPLLIVPMTLVFFAGAGAAFDAPSLTTVDVLLSLDSLMPLIRRAFAVTAPFVVPVAGVVPGFLPRTVPVAELAVVDVEAFPRFPPASFLVERAFSAQLLKRLDVLLCFTGDFDGPVAFSGAGVGRVSRGLPPGIGRGTERILADAGERTLEAFVASTSAAVVPRAFFLGTSKSAVAPPCSLPSPDISSLGMSAHVVPWKDGVVSNLVLLGGRPGPGRDDAVP